MDAQEYSSARMQVVRRPGLDGPGRRAALTELTDTWLASLFRAAGSPASSMCLVAVGGYGRGELTLGSDLDLLLLHRGVADEADSTSQSLWYPIWDSGVRLDHSVRTVAEARRLASTDLKVLLGLLDMRPIAGDGTLVEELSAAVLADWRASAADRLSGLRTMVEERRERLGEASQVTEPNIKEAYGGLRDATVLRGIAASWLTDVPHTGWEDAVRFLLDVRESLHRLTGQGNDVLLMQEQAAVAEDLVGVADPDALLRAVYDSARTIGYASDVTWHRVERITTARRRRTVRPFLRRTPARAPLADGIVLQDGEAVLALDARPATDPDLALRAAAAAAQAGVPVSPHTLERLVAECPDLPVPWDRLARESFVSLLGSGSSLPGVWEAFDQAGWVSRWLPDWDVVRSAPQRNALHRFTVDRHLVETAVQASARTRHVDRPDLLLVGALLHDIGKARGGDHSVVGARIAGDLARRMGFEEADIDVIVALVRHHLLLGDVATRRDLDDHAVIAEVAVTLGSVQVLDLLHELSIADALATGPTVSSEWRLGLVADLVERTRKVLHGRDLPEPPGLTEVQRVALEQEGVWAVMEEHGHTCTVTVAARDQLGLLGTVAGVLSLNRLHVLAAKVRTVEGRAVQEWTVRPAFGDPPEASQLGEDIRRAIEGTYDVAERITRRDADYAGPGTAFAAPTVDLHPAADGATAVVEVRAHDAPGLLYRVARAVSAADVDIYGAKVSTLGSEAVDAFFVRAPDGAALSEDRLAALRVTVLSALGEASAAPVLRA